MSRRLYVEPPLSQTGTSSQDDGRKIFNEADPKGTGMLDKEEFAVARKLQMTIAEPEARAIVLTI